MINSARGRLKLVGIGILSFILVLAASEIALAIMNTLAAESLPFGAYTITLVALPIFALVVSFIIVIVFYIRAQKTETLIESLNRVATGDYSVAIEFSRGDTFAKVYRNFNIMTRELSSVKTLRDEFVHNFSHEIKTPLFSIQGFANLMLDGGISEDEQKKFLKIISDEAGRLFKLADSMLTLSKLENQQMIGERQTLKLDSEITDCIIMLEREWEDKKIEISSELEPVKIKGDAPLLKHVWLNLLSNAIKFTPEGGKIEVSLKRVGESAEVYFRDTGCGISPEDMPRLFDKYYRSESAKSTPGNGLGLAICKRICALSGGTITAASDGAGATFTVVLPLE